MIKTVEREIAFCDNCGSDKSVYYDCAGCGKQFCNDCQDNIGVGKKFTHGVYCSGSTDAFLCTNCLVDIKPRTKEILGAYNRMAVLRIEYKAWQEDFDKRVKEAEAFVKKIAEKYDIK